MIDHVIFSVADFERSKAFYETALAPLGIALMGEFELYAAFGRDGKPFFWVSEREPREGAHVAFAADDRAAVDAFYAAGLAAGGQDNGAPGPRPHYHEHYYGAFVLDPDGNNVEAVCHTP